MPTGRATLHTAAPASRPATSLPGCLAAAAPVLARTRDAVVPAVAHHLASALSSPLVVIGELDGHTLRTVCVVRHGALAPNVTTTLPMPGRSAVTEGDVLWLPDGVIGPDACLAVIQTAAAGMPACLLAVAVAGVEDAPDAHVLLPLFAPRVAEVLAATAADRSGRQGPADTIGRLAGGVAHDFNNLLMIMIGYAEMLRDQHGSSDEIDELLTAGSRASTLIRQLLAYGRRQVLHGERLDVNWVLSQVEDTLRPMLGTQVRLHCEAGADVPDVRADLAQLQHVLVTLALAARDAMPDGGSITLATCPAHLTVPAPHMPAGHYACIEVSDSGAPIAPDVLAHIFEPFSTTKGGRGGGLGLASIDGTVQQSGGFISCDSGPGQGTTFRLYLPADA